MSRHSLENLYHNWLKLVDEYMATRMTKEDDKLPAISGLARKMAEITSDEYHAGLWKTDLIRQLCWLKSKKQSFSLRRPDFYRAPSWTWASIEGSIAYPVFDWDPKRRYCTTASPEILEVTITLKGPDPFGPVSGGSIRLKGCIATIEPVFPVMPLDSAVYIRQTSTRLAILDGSEHGRYIGLLVLDISTLFRSLDDSFLYCLRMWQFQEQSLEVLEDDGKSWQCRLIGLALKVVDANRAEFERVGIVYIRPEAERWLEDCGEEVEITLV